MSTPQSTIYICSGVKLNSRYEHSIYFASAAAQQEYFSGKVVKTLAAYSYLRKHWPLKVEATMEQAKTWSYLFFRNSPTGKLYYYFIKNVEYINDSTVELTLELDVIQTYLFEFKDNMLPCFIERNHTVTDEPGEHTVDEGLELGELYDSARSEFNPGELCIMVMATINPEQPEAEALPYMYNGVFSGVKIWAIDGSDWAAWGSKLAELDEGKKEGIIAMWMYPKALVKLGGEDTWENGLVHVVERAITHADGVEFGPGEYRQTFDGYHPKNQKLHTYPFHFLYVTNNQGNSAAFRYERFDGEPTFALSGALSPDGGVRITPIGYNGVTYNYKEGLTLTGYPTCAWDSDVYKMWLAQNQNSQIYNGVMGGLKVLGGVASGVASILLPDAGILGGIGVGTAWSGLTQIGNALAQKTDKAIEPPQAKGNFSTSVNITNNMQSFSIYERCVSAENARIIDDYFTMYGYKLNRVAEPTLCARPHFTYIKTVGCHIKSNMCNEDTVKIESIFDNGITLWLNGDEIGNYALDNRA